MTGYDQDKVFAPTPRKRRQARELGQVVISPDLVSGMLLLALTGLLHYFGNRLIDESGTFLRGSLEQVQVESFDSRGELTTHLVSHFGNSAEYFLVRLWPFWMLSLVAVVAVLAQTRGLFHWQAVAPSLNRVNPASGFQRFALSELARRLFGTTLKVASFASIGWYWVVRQHQLVAHADLAHQTRAEFDQAVMFLFTLSAGFLGWGLVDYVFRRLRFEKQLRMTARELADEQKQFNPDPALNRRGRELRERFSEAVGLNRNTDLLITDGLTGCILFRFDPQTQSVPVIVVRQSDTAGVRLLQRCLQSRVPIHEAVDLQRELNRTAGLVLPEHLWSEVAELFSRRPPQTETQNPAGEPAETTRVTH